MIRHCPECGCTELKDEGKYYVCDFCGKKTLKSSLDLVTQNESRFVDDFIKKNAELFSFDFNDEHVTKDDLIAYSEELKKSLSDQHDEAFKASVKSILSDLSDRILSFLPKKIDTEEQKDESLDYESKVDRCKDLEDLTAMGNILRKRIESSFYKVELNGNPLFKKEEGKTLITKETYRDFYNHLVANNKIDKDIANQAYLTRKINKLPPYPKNNSLFISDNATRFLSIGVPYKNLDKAYDDWKFLNTCSHEYAEENEEISKNLLPIQRGKEYLKEMYRYYKDLKIID